VRRFLIPEVVQTSAMDCGPASLKALLEGFGISASYGRLREACQTDVDGTSIDRLEEAAVQPFASSLVELGPELLFDRRDRRRKARRSRLGSGHGREAHEDRCKDRESHRGALR